MAINIDYQNIEEPKFKVDIKEIFNPEKVPFLKYRPELVREIKEKLPKVKEKFSTMVVCGMGGSSLGAKTIDSFAKAYEKSEHRLVFLDNIDPTMVKQTLEALNWKDTVFCFVSKSGTTLETIVFLNLILEELKKKNLPISEHVVFVGDRGRNFEKLANDLGTLFFEIPCEVDGRFSVLTSTGLVPAYFVDFEIEELWEGAKEVLKEQTEENEAIKLAKVKMDNYLNQNRNISVMFAYGNYIYTFAFWYSQLWAESLGKNGKGQTPVKALGTVDQHSLVQLFREGPDDKVYQFIKVKEIKWDLKLPEETLIFDYIKGKKVSEIFTALYRGTKEALEKTDRPVITCLLYTSPSPRDRQKSRMPSSA
jgi:glucose-6-phosphate isomerase